MESVKQFIASGTDINTQNAQGETVAMIAVKNGRLNVIQYLFENGADIAVADNNGETLFTAAQKSGLPEIAEYVMPFAYIYDYPTRSMLKNDIQALADYIDVSTTESEEEKYYSFKRRIEVMQSALHMKNFGIFEFFQGDIDLNDSFDDHDGTTFLHEAARNGQTEAIRYLLSKGADINIENLLGYTPVILAFEYGHEQTLQFLLSRGANLNISIKEDINDNVRIPILFVYYNKDNFAFFRRFIESGADINIADYRGETVLFKASNKNSADFEIASLLIEKGANVNAKNEEGKTPLFYAVELTDTSLAKLLIDNGADVNAQDNKLKTPLFDGLVYFTLDIELIKYFLEKGMDINHKDILGDTPLHIAAQNGNVKIVEFLVENGADVNAKNNEGHTPIHYADHGLGIIEYLISKGADKEDARLLPRFTFSI